ncbi:MAG: sugar transferase [Blautia sp.]|nr:sugar transferase [Blautia sp.]
MGKNNVTQTGVGYPYEIRSTLRIIYLILTFIIVFLTAIFLWYINVRIDWRRGSEISATLFVEGIIYSLTYGFFSGVYGANQIEGKRFSDLVFSQMLAYALSDICLYGAAFVWFHNFSEIYISRFALVYLIQVLLSAGLTYLFCKLYKRFAVPRKVLVIYGDDSYKDFVNILKKSKWKQHYCLESCLPQTADWQDIREALGFSQEVYLCHVERDFREKVVVQGSIGHRRIFFTPEVSDILSLKTRTSVTFGIPFIEVKGLETEWYYGFAKRAFDLVASAVVLLTFSPAFLIVGLINQCICRQGFLSRTKCLTKGGYVFHLFQFAGLADNPTAFGKGVRRVRLDRLPEFLCSLKGTMSIVGPSPVDRETAWSYIDTVPDYRIRHNAKAGITGYAQVCCSKDASFEDRLKMDIVYCSQMSIYTDLRIIFYSIKRWVEKVKKD